MWDTLSDERTRLSFDRLLALASVVSLGVESHFTVSDFRLSFLLPPTTRRVTVEVFE
jgi:hypothetical protein